MKGRKSVLLGGVNVLYGVLIFITPVIFPICNSLMRCYYMVRAELSLGFLVFFTGLLLAFSKSTEARILLHAILVSMSSLIILIPEWLIGVCAGTTMPCNMGTRPAFILLGILLIVTNVYGFLISRKKEGV